MHLWAVLDTRIIVWKIVMVQITALLSQTGHEDSIVTYWTISTLNLFVLNLYKKTHFITLMDLVGLIDFLIPFYHDRKPIMLRVNVQELLLHFMSYSVYLWSTNGQDHLNLSSKLNDASFKKIYIRHLSSPWRRSILYTWNVMGLFGTSSRVWLPEADSVRTCLISFFPSCSCCFCSPPPFVPH